jgi:ribokinase
MLRARGAGNVVVTLGRRGAMVVTATIDTIVPAAAVEAVDTTGAGDAFNAGFAVALAEGREVLEAVRYGVACGALVCTRLGVIPGLPQRAAADAMLRRIV